MGALALFALGLRTERSPRMRGTRVVSYRRGLPWVVGAMLLMGSVLTAIPGVPLVVVIGLVPYTGLAVMATWRMSSLDRASPWMLPSHRLARFGFSLLGLTWLGIVLGLLLQIVDLILAYPAAS